MNAILKESISEIKWSPSESRALDLLGSGISPVQCAAALGLTESRISQLMSQEEFAQEVAQRRFNLLQSNNIRDSKYDSIEDRLLEKLSNCLDFMVRPMEIIRAITMINGAKRRGSSAPEIIHNQSTIVNLILPNQTINRFTTNIHNQVIKTDDRDLVTIQSSSLLSTLKSNQSELLKAKVRELTHRDSNENNEVNDDAATNIT